MSEFYLKNEQRENLKFLRDKPLEHIVDLCKLSFEYLSAGTNEKKNQIISKKLNCSLNYIPTTIEALISLLIEATKFNATETELQNLKNDGFSDDQILILSQFVSSKKAFIEKTLQTTNIKTYRLVDLEWRLEAKIASRCLLNQTSIIITMKLNLHTNPNSESRNQNIEDNKDLTLNNNKYFLIQTDPNNLVHIIDILEQAVLESKNSRVRSICDAIN